jgi:large subunit ribosomal protein L13
MYAPHMDVGDFVVVINASQIRLTGQKLEQKRYYRYSGYPGGLKFDVLKDVLKAHPERVLEHAVEGMLPRNTLGRGIFGRLKVYPGPNHPHRAQVGTAKPEDPSQQRGDR